MFTPQEVADKRFDRAVFGGYNMENVDVFLDQLTIDYRALYEENEKLKEKLKVMVETVEEYRSVDASMRSVLSAAQKMAQETLEKARAQKDELLQKAQTEANGLTERIKKDNETELMRQDRLREETRRFSSLLHEIYTRQLALIEAIPQMSEEDIRRAKTPTDASRAFERSVLDAPKPSSSAPASPAAAPTSPSVPAPVSAPAPSTVSKTSPAPSQEKSSPPSGNETPTASEDMVAPSLSARYTTPKPIEPNTPKPVSVAEPTTSQTRATEPASSKVSPTTSHVSGGVGSPAYPPGYVPYPGGVGGAPVSPASGAVSAQKNEPPTVLPFVTQTSTSKGPITSAPSPETTERYAPRNIQLDFPGASHPGERNV